MNVSIMTETMAGFWSKLTREEVKKVIKDYAMRGLADTGAQTNSADPELLNSMGFPPEKMLQTSHNIQGAVDSDLDIM